MGKENILKKVLENINDGVILLDENLTILSINEPSNIITGCKKDEAIGKNIYDVFPTLNNDSSRFCKSLATNEPSIDYFQNFTNKKGRDTFVLTSTIPLDRDNEFSGVILILKDYTNVKSLAEKMLVLQGTLYGEKTVDNKFLPNGTIQDIDDIVSKSSIMDRLKNDIYSIKDSVEPVFIYGDTGVGKELVAESIHNTSRRRERPYITQRCCVMPDKLLESILFGTYRGSFIGAQDKPGLLEITDGGTLFLDDIECMGIELQKKIVEVFDRGYVSRIASKRKKKVDIRLIASSDIEPGKLVEMGRLDQGFYKILRNNYIMVPALRSRKEDIPSLVDHFIDESNKLLGKGVLGVRPEVMDYFMEKQWNGNVRELKNTIEMSMNIVEGDYISLEDLGIVSMANEESDVLSYDIELGDIDLKEAVEDYERHIIKYALAKSNNNCAEAARKLKVPKQTLHGKLKRYGLIE